MPGTKPSRPTARKTAPTARAAFWTGVLNLDVGPGVRAGCDAVMRWPPVVGHRRCSTVLEANGSLVVPVQSPCKLRTRTGSSQAQARFAAPLASQIHPAEMFRDRTNGSTA